VETPVGRMTGNVLTRFLDDEPFTAPGAGKTAGTAMSERSAI
jgi:hypothetical protein